MRNLVKQSIAAVIISLLVALSAVSSFAMSGEGCGGAGDCTNCHSLTLKEAEGLLKGVGTVAEVKPAQVRGLYEVTLEKDGKRGLVYLDYGKKHLIAGQVFDLAAGGSLAAPPPPKQPTHIDPASIGTDNALLMGNPKAKKRLYVFTDPECPFCAKLHAELKKLVASDKDVAVVIKLFPLDIHPHSYDKARVILGEKSLKLLDTSYAGGALPAPGNDHPRKGVDAVKAFGKSVGIISTPTMVLPDGRVVVGSRDAAELKKLLAQ